jgi:Xaa-Pro aminopeptidase
MTDTTVHTPTRVERLRAWLETAGLDCAVVFGADPVNHLAGYWRYYGGPAGLVVGRDGERTLVVALDEAPIARELSSADEVLPYGERGFGLDLDPLGRLIPVLVAVPALARARRVGVASELPGAEERLAGAMSAELVPAAAELARIRLRKDPDELERVRAAYELCWTAQAAIAAAAAPGVSEIELFAEATKAALVAAGTPIELLGDLISGPDAADVCGPIRVPGKRAVADGEGIVADIVVRRAGYWGDTAETHLVGDADEVRAARERLYEILRSCATRLVPGATGAEVFAEMQRQIADSFPDGEFPHHGGHGVGLGSVDDPHVIPSDTTALEAGMVLALEPGVYYQGRYGARVEEMYVVTDAGGVELREHNG